MVLVGIAFVIFKPVLIGRSDFSILSDISVGQYALDEGGTAQPVWERMPTLTSLLELLCPLWSEDFLFLW